MMVYFVRSDRDWSLIFNTLKEAEKCFESWKDDYMSEGVSLDDSFVEIHEVKSKDDEDIDNSKVIKRVEVTVDEQQYKDFGNPKDQGMDFEFWAKWQEVKV
jgi:hypothetical protein